MRAVSPAEGRSDTSLVLREALGQRHFTASELPLSVGGAGSAVLLAGRPAGAEAWLGVHEEQLYVQPSEEAEVLHNGVRIRRSTWLKPGDVVNFGAARLRVREEDGQRVVEVEDGSGGNITAPPIITEASRVRGESDSDSDLIAAIRFRPGSGAAPRRRNPFTLTRVILFCVALVIAGVLWFVFTAISISIGTDPAGARVQVKGSMPAIPLGNRMLLPPGTYQVRATAPGYRPGQATIKVTEAVGQQFPLALVKLPGRLRIEVPESVQVSLDGNASGAAPGEFELAPGNHTVAIASTRYQPFSASVAVEGLGKTQSFAPKLVPAWGNVAVTTEPAGAQLIVDGQARGVTPLTAEIPAGNHPIELRLEGFKPWTTDVQVKANEPLTLGPVRLGLPDGRLSLRSDPAGAAVSVAGVYRGQTPLDIELRPDLAQSVVLSKAGYEAATRQVTVKSGERQTLVVPMSGVFGEVAIRGQPADAELFIDGKPGGSVNQTLKLVATTHDIEIRKAGFVTFKNSITPRPGLPQVVEATLLTAEQTRLAVTPALIKSKSEQQLKLMPIGRFTMGSPRREPGRRANEAQRDVELRRPFYFGVKEVTNAEFRRFRPAHKSGIMPPNTLDLENQPVVSITWDDAVAYCNWLSEQEGLPPAYKKEGDSFVALTPVTKGYRLPTDAEWEWVARHAGNGRQLRYPWGDALPVAAASGNYADHTARIVIQDVIPDYDDGYAVTAPVGKFPPNALGLYDMGGNAAEWANDFYSVSFDALQVAIDPLGPPQGKNHVIRGSSWKQSGITDLRLSARDFGEGSRNDVGFRLARYVE